MKLGFFLINLDDSKHRLEAATKELNSYGIDFTRVPAYDGRCLKPTSIDSYNEEQALKHMGRPLLGGELGCYLSHLQTAELFLETDNDYAVVLEDDMVIRADLAEYIPLIIDRLNKNTKVWHLVNIGASKHKIYSAIDTINQHQLIHAHYFPMTTTGLLWSREGAEEFVSKHNRIFAPVDNYFRDWLTKANTGFSIYPPLVTPSGAESEIDKHPNSKIIKEPNTRKKMKRHPLYGFRKQKRLWRDKAIALKHKINR